MSDPKDRDIFEVDGEFVEIKKGQRYRIALLSGELFEGTCDGFFDFAPWNEMVSLHKVIQLEEAHGLMTWGSVGFLLLKSRIKYIERTGEDLYSIKERARESAFSN